ncbi:MAG TPA: helix-turn-helix transcriptional regulator [Pseudolabrys sp.]
MIKAREFTNQAGVQPKAVQGLAKMRSVLRESIPAFAAAENSAQGAEHFCHSVRQDLQRRRKAQRVGQADVGVRLGLSQSAVSKIETGKGDLSLKTLYLYAEALGLEPAVVFVPSALSMESLLPASAALNSAFSSQAAFAVGAQIELIKRVSECVTGTMTGLVTEAKELATADG